MGMGRDPQWGTWAFAENRFAHDNENWIAARAALGRNDDMGAYRW